MNRIPYPDPETLSAAKRALLDGASGVLNVSRMAMHATDALWLAQRRLGQAAVYESTLDERLREMLILRVAYLSDSEYELFHHLSIAEHAGVTAEQRDAMRTGNFAQLTADERALANFVTEVVRDVRPSDETLQTVRDAYGLPLVFEMIVLIGSYMLTARVAAASGVECDEVAVSAWKR